MNIERAYMLAEAGEKLTADHMQPGCYMAIVEGSLRRMWANGDGCTFIEHEEDRRAVWRKREAKDMPKWA